MYVMNKKRSEIVKVDISGRIFVRDSAVCSGRPEEKPSYLGDYESEEQAKIALDMLFEALGNPRNAIYRMPLDRDVRARIVNIAPDVERHFAAGKKTKGHGGS